MKKNIAKSSIIIFVIGILSKLMGVIRQSILTGFYGQTDFTDAYYAAYKAALLVTFVINTTIHLAIIPIITKVRQEQGEDERNKYFSRIFNIVILVDIVLVLLTIIFAPTLAKFVAPKFDKEQLELTIKMVRIIAPSVIFLGAVACSGAYLQTNFSFGPFASIGIVNNIIFFIFLFLFGKSSSIELVAWVTTIGAMGQAVFIAFFMKKNKFKYSIGVTLKDKYIKETFILLLPLMLNDLVNQVVGVFNTRIGSGLEGGKISVITNSYNLFNAILSLFIVTVSTVIYPVLSEAFNSKNFELIKKYIKNGINTIFLFIIPATVGIMVLSEPIVKLLYERGEFKANDTLLVQAALICYAIGFTTNGLKIYLNKIYFSYQDTITPLINQIIIVVINILIAIPLVKVIEYKALALATSIASIVGALFLLYMLRYKVKGIDYKNIVVNFIKVLIASLIMGLVVYGTYKTTNLVLGTGFISTFIKIVVSVAIGIIIYGILIYLLKIEEFQVVFTKIKNKVKNK